MLLWHRLEMFERHLAIEAGNTTMVQRPIKGYMMKFLHSRRHPRNNPWHHCVPSSMDVVVDASRLLALRGDWNVHGSSVSSGRRSIVDALASNAHHCRGHPNHRTHGFLLLASSRGKYNLTAAFVYYREGTAFLSRYIGGFHVGIGAKRKVVGSRRPRRRLLRWLARLMRPSTRR